MQFILKLSFAMTFLLSSAAAARADDKALHPVTLLKPLAFHEKIVGGAITRADAMNLFDLKVPVGSAENDGVALTSAEDIPRKTTARTCGEYLKLVRGDWYPLTTFDTTMESFFKATCEVLDLASRAAPSKTSNFTGMPKSLRDLDRYPAAMLGLISAAGPDEYPACAEATSFTACAALRGGKIAFENGGMIKFSDESYVADFTPALKGDLNRDGVEDLVYSYGYHAAGGSFRAYGHVCLESPDGKTVNALDCGL